MLMCIPLDLLGVRVGLCLLDGMLNLESFILYLFLGIYRSLKPFFKVILLRKANRVTVGYYRADQSDQMIF